MRHAVHVLAFLCAFCTGRVDAAVYYVVTNASATFASFGVCAGQCQAVSIVAGTTGGPAANVTYQVIVSNGGACTVQPIGSNDPTKTAWVNQGSAITVTSGSVTGGAAITATWAYWSATVTTLTGTGATCTVTVSG